MAEIFGKIRRPTILGASALAGLFVKAQAREQSSTMPSRNVQFVESTSLASSIGASLVAYLAVGTGAVRHSMLDRGHDTISAFDFMTSEQVANIRNGVPTDITAAL